MEITRTFPASAALLLLLLNLSFNPRHTSADSKSPSADMQSRRENGAAYLENIKRDLKGLIWPTDASVRVTSSFAEYRSTHFHGGIDISTNGQTGYKVFAVTDGYVYRIRISPTGYGKMLFIKHKGGFLSTYAHLSRFSDEINTAARAEQYRTGKYSIDLLPDSVRLPVKKGDVVAYSGGTGFGPPHLHFEIRDENLNPVNPLLSQGFSVKDDIPPSIRRVMVSPLDYASAVDEATGPKFFSRFPRKHHILTIPQTIRMHGRIGIGVEAEDKFDGTWSKAGIHSMQLYLDDSLTFSMELNNVPAEETKQIDLHYDLSAIFHGWGKFQKLYIDAGNSLPFYGDRPAGTGVINIQDLSEGRHGYRIVCMDIQGNRTELEGTLLANHNPEIAIDRIENNAVYIRGKDLSSITKFYLYGKRMFQPSWLLHTLSKGRFEVKSGEVVLPVNTKPYDVVKIVAENQYGSHSSNQISFIKKPAGPARPLHIDSEVLNDYIRFTLTTPGVFTTGPRLWVQEGNSEREVELEALEVSKYTGSFVPSVLCEGARPVRAEAEVNGKQSRASDEIAIYPVSPDRSGSFTADEGNLKISYDSGAVYKPLYMLISSENNRQSVVYSLQPLDVLLDGGIRVQVPCGTNSAQGHPALYFRTTGGWSFQTAHPDTDGKTFTATITRTLGELAVLEDHEQPLISRLRAQAHSGILEASFRYFDNLSGVDPDEIRMRVDDRLVIPEIDGEKRKVWYRSDEKLQRGKHSLVITMKDRAGNETEISRAIVFR